MLKEFREFILKGNAFDLAVGVIIGAAFGGIVASLVSDILMPPIGALMGNLNFTDYFVDLTALKAKALGEPAQIPASYEAAKQTGHAILAYGKFLTALINLLIVGFVIFLLVKQVNRLKREPAARAQTFRDARRCAALEGNPGPACVTQPRSLSDYS